MSSTALEPITSDLPLDRRTRRRLEKVIRAARDHHHALTFEQILRRVDSIQPEFLSMILARVVDLGLARRIIRVESPRTKVGLGDYDELKEIPLRVLDEEANEEITVTPDDLRVIYKF